METTQATQKRTLPGWARALIIALILGFLAVVFITAGATSAATLFGFAAFGIAVLGGIIGLAGLSQKNDA